MTRHAVCPEQIYKCPKCSNEWRILKGDTNDTIVRCMACCERFQIGAHLQRRRGKMNVIYLDRFDTVSHLRGRNRTYENIKAAVLAAGRFSCFDVETKKDGVMFTKLCNDPELEIDTVNFVYPWTGVRTKVQPSTSKRRNS